MQAPMHPGVLRLIGLAGDACEAAACPLGVCGSAAGDRVAAAGLGGLGVRELSASAARIPELKAHLRGLTLATCRKAALSALAAATPEAARAAAAGVIDALSNDQGANDNRDGATPIPHTKDEG